MRYSSSAELMGYYVARSDIEMCDPQQLAREGVSFCEKYLRTAITSQYLKKALKKYYFFALLFEAFRPAMSLRSIAIV